MPHQGLSDGDPCQNLRAQKSVEPAMRNVSLSCVFRRTQSGQAMQWGESSLPLVHERLLLRVNGYTALVELLHDSEPVEQMLSAADELVAIGLIECADAKSVQWPPASAWGDLGDLH
jgi:hypothetical protein